MIDVYDMPTCEIRIDGDTVYMAHPVYGIREGFTVEERFPVMTKEVFVECYNKWIKDGLLEDIKKVSVALSNITNKECCDYGYEEACEIADRYAEGSKDESGKMD